jgi:hypothetical protein
MGVHSGKFGVVNGMSTVRNWNITDELSNPKFTASNTAGGTGRKTGIDAWTGSFGYFGATPTVMPGESFTFKGYCAPDNDTLAGVGTNVTGTALIDSVVISWNWTNGDIISAVANFSGHLGLTENLAAAAIADATTPDAPAACGTKIEYSSDGVTYTELANLTQATLTISAANQSYVNSGTSCGTGRKPGPIDWSLSITQQEQANILTNGNNYFLKCWIDGVNFWHLKWGKYKGRSNLSVDMESGAIISHVKNFEMNGYNTTQGFIKLPAAGANWWG